MGFRFQRPCEKCGRLTANGFLCDFHRAEANTRKNLADRERKIRSGQYSGSYKTRAKQVRDNAQLCHLCGEGFRFDDPWQADHVIPGDPDSPLLPAHRSCNARRGNRPL